MEKGIIDCNPSFSPDIPASANPAFLKFKKRVETHGVGHSRSCGYEVPDKNELNKNYRLVLAEAVKLGSDTFSAVVNKGRGLYDYRNYMSIMQEDATGKYEQIMRCFMNSGSDIIVFNPSLLNNDNGFDDYEVYAFPVTSLNGEIYLRSGGSSIKLNRDAEIVELGTPDMYELVKYDSSVVAEVYVTDNIGFCVPEKSEDDSMSNSFVSKDFIGNVYRTFMESVGGLRHVSNDADLADYLKDNEAVVFVYCPKEKDRGSRVMASLF